MLFLVGKFFTNVHPLSFKTKKHWSDFLFGYFKVTRFHEDIFLFDFEEEVTKKLMKIRLWNVNEVISALTNNKRLNCWWSSRLMLFMEVSIHAYEKTLSLSFIDKHERYCFRLLLSLLI